MTVPPPLQTPTQRAAPHHPRTPSRRTEILCRGSTSSALPAGGAEVESRTEWEAYEATYIAVYMCPHTCRQVAQRLSHGQSVGSDADPYPRPPCAALDVHLPTERVL